MSDSTAIAKAWRLLRRQGISSLVQTVGRKAYDRHQSAWFARPLDDSLEVISPRFEGWMDFDHPNRVLDFIHERNLPGMNDPVEIESMKRRGHIFAGVMDGERIIGFIKLGWETVYVLDYGLDICVNPGDFFVIDIFIGSESRGLGAGPFLVSAASLEMKKRGFKRGVMHVRLDKTPMLRTCARTGYREIGRVDYRSILGRKVLRPHPEELIAADSPLPGGSS
jgi:ribosomal protein S18 acetylase RimI-like enzyme